MSTVRSIPKDQKIVIIGAGSSYTPEIMAGILERTNSLSIRSVVFYDIPEGAAQVEILLELAHRMIKKAGLSEKIHLTLSYDLDAALEQADFVFTQLRVGGLKARELDESLPLAYGFLGQETTGIGGLFKGLRTIPVILDIARAMERICPDAWLINFTNPSGMVTEAVLKHTRIKCIGLCNVPINMIQDLEHHLCLEEKSLFCRFVGLNHLSFITEVRSASGDHLPQILRDPEAPYHAMANIPDIVDRGGLMRMLGVIPSTYLSYYYFHDQMVAEERQAVAEGRGTRARQVMAVQSELFAAYQSADLDEKPLALEKRGGSLYAEAAMQLMTSIVLDQGDIQVVNAQNKGALDTLPYDAVIETNCLITGSGPIPLAGGKLPSHIIGLVQSVKHYETLVIRAVTERNLDFARQALLTHPLCRDLDTAMVLFDELYQAHLPYLSYFETSDPV